MKFPPEMANFKVYDPRTVGAESQVLGEPFATFKAYGATYILMEDDAHNVWQAALGSDGDNKLTFYVWCWVERPTGAVEIVSIQNPPGNSPSFAVVKGKLILSGVRDGEIVRCEVPGFVAPLPPLTAGQILTIFIQQLSKPESNITKAVGAAALAAISAAVLKAIQGK